MAIANAYINHIRLTIVEKIEFGSAVRTGGNKTAPSPFPITYLLPGNMLITNGALHFFTLLRHIHIYTFIFVVHMLASSTMGDKKFHFSPPDWI